MACTDRHRSVVAMTVSLLLVGNASGCGTPRSKLVGAPLESTAPTWYANPTPCTGARAQPSEQDPVPHWEHYRGDLYAAKDELPPRCYCVTMTTYRPALNLYDDYMFTLLPRWIALHQETAEKGELGAMSPGPRTPEGNAAMMTGHWEGFAGDGIVLVWTNRHSGVVVKAERTPYGYEGTARTFWDFGRRSQRAEVTLHGIPCWQGLRNKAGVA